MEAASTVGATRKRMSLLLKELVALGLWMVRPSLLRLECSESGTYCSKALNDSRSLGVRSREEASGRLWGRENGRKDGEDLVCE